MVAAGRVRVVVELRRAGSRMCISELPVEAGGAAAGGGSAAGGGAVAFCGSSAGLTRNDPMMNAS